MALGKKIKKILGDDAPVEVAAPAAEPVAKVEVPVHTYKALGVVRCSNGDSSLRLVELDENDKLLSVKEIRRGRDIHIIMEQFKIESVRHKIMKPGAY